MVELGVDRFRALRDFKAAAATVQVGNKVCLSAFAAARVRMSGLGAYASSMGKTHYGVLLV